MQVVTVYKDFDNGVKIHRVYISLPEQQSVRSLALLERSYLNGKFSTFFDILYTSNYQNPEMTSVKFANEEMLEEYLGNGLESIMFNVHNVGKDPIREAREYFISKLEEFGFPIDNYASMVRNTESTPVNSRPYIKANMFPKSFSKN